MIRIAVAGLTAVTLLLLGAVAGLSYRRRSTPGAWPLVGMMGAGMFWVAVRGFQLLSVDGDLIILLAEVKWLGITTMPMFWLLFCLAYVGEERFVNWQTVATLSVVPVLVVTVALLGPGGLLYRSIRIKEFMGLVVSHTLPGPFHWVGIVYAYLLVVGGVAVLVRYLAVDQRRYRVRTAALLAGIGVPAVAGVVSALDLVPFEPTPFLLPVTGIACLAAVYRYRALDARPVPSHVARKQVVERIDTGVVVVDENGAVVDYNGAADRWLDVEEGTAAAAVVPGYDAIGPGESTMVEERTGGRRRSLEVREVAGDDLVGAVVTIRDVTDRRRRVQRLSVLNRVLRHNVRNEMNLVQGYATESDDEMADQVVTAARRVVELSEEARAAQRLLAAERSYPSEPARDLVGRVVETVRSAYPAVSIRVDDDGGGRCYCDPRLAPVLHPLVENAAEHNDAADPTVVVSLDCDGPEWLRVGVADNGPGIPEMERRVLDRSTEDDLEHGSGLGLWLAAWGARALGGSIGFEENEPRGSVVTVRVPAATDPVSAPERIERGYDPVAGAGRDLDPPPPGEGRPPK